jgi:hypothetical protein
MGTHRFADLHFDGRRVQDAVSAVHAMHVAQLHLGSRRLQLALSNEELLLLLACLSPLPPHLAHLLLGQLQRLRNGRRPLADRLYRHWMLY